MSEEVIEPITIPPKPKQYLLMVDDVAMVLLNKLSPGLMFVEVQGMNMKDDEKNLVLVTPKI